MHPASLPGSNQNKAFVKFFHMTYAVSAEILIITLITCLTVYLKVLLLRGSDRNVTSLGEPVT